MTILDDLKEIGLSEYEAKTYRALYESGEQTSRQVSELSKVPLTRVFDVLNSLRELGLVELIQQKPMVWLAIKPEAGLKTLIERKTSAYTEAGNRLVNELKRTRQEPSKKILERVTIQSGFDEVVEVVTQQIAGSAKEVCGYFIGDPLPAHAEITDMRAVRRGVVIRQIVRTYTEQNRPTLENWIKEGMRIKYLKGTDDYSFFVFDRKRCAIVVKDPKIEDEKIIIVFENEGLSAALYDYFNSLWAKAKSLDEIKPMPQ